MDERSARMLAEIKRKGVMKATMKIDVWKKKNVSKLSKK